MLRSVNYVSRNTVAQTQLRSVSTQSSTTGRLINPTTKLGRVSLVSGGSQGIGKSTCLRFAQEGARVVITDIPKLSDQGEELAREIRNNNGEAIFVPLDVGEEKHWQQAVEAAENKFGPLDVLVNNAGIVDVTNFEEQTLDQWHNLMRVNVDGVFLGSKYAIQSMKKREDKEENMASIINISSIAGLVGFPLTIGYSASKGAVRLLTKSLALYCTQAKLGIRVNSVHPGAVKTPILDALPTEALDAIVATHPVGRLGRPKEIADGCVYLASDESSFMTGAELVLDGGYTAQ